MHSTEHRSPIPAADNSGIYVTDSSKNFTPNSSTKVLTIQSLVSLYGSSANSSENSSESASVTPSKPSTNLSAQPSILFENSPVNSPLETNYYPPSRLNPTRAKGLLLLCTDSCLIASLSLHTRLRLCPTYSRRRCAAGRHCIHSGASLTRGGRGRDRTRSTRRHHTGSADTQTPASPEAQQTPRCACTLKSIETGRDNRG